MRRVRELGARLVRAWLAHGLEETIVMVGVLLIVVALWGRFGRLVLVIPGVMLIWIALPPRAPFIARAPEKEPTA